jgi:hypothetical protein
MGQARVRRGAVALLAGAALLVAPIVVLLTPASAAGASLVVLSSKSYTDPFDGDVIVGELQNTGTAPTGIVQVDVTWLDGAGHSLGTEVLGYATVEVIDAGPSSSRSNRSPFRGRVTPPPGYVSYALAATPSDASAALNHNFAVEVTGQSVDADGLHHLTGTVTNSNDVPADAVNVVATLYDAAGAADDQAVELISRNTPLAPGQSDTFDAVSEDSGRPFASYAVLAQSSTPGSVPVSPSPSASTATHSPSATSTGDPSATASSTPTAPPPPCRPGGGSYAITSSPAYAKIPRGGHVRLVATLAQAGRVCQAGLRMSSYVRGPGTTLYHLSRTATTSSAGRVLFDYSAVRADFRWYALAQGAHSSTGLVQAR